MASEFHATLTARPAPVELPSEIIYLVVQALHEAEGIEEKRGLAACSLTCYYWSTVLQPLLYHSLALRGLDDVKQLLEFIRTSPHLAGFIREIHVVQYSHSFPWFHHVFKVLNFLSLDVQTTLTIKARSDPTPAETSTKPTKHRDPLINPFPRQLPLPHLRINRLVIDGIKVRRREDLARFIRHLRDLHSCAMQRVTFLESHMAEEVPLAPRNLPEALDEIEVSQCHDENISDQLALASSFIPNDEFESVWPLTVDVLLALHEHPLPGCRRNVRVSLADSEYHFSIFCLGV